MPAAKKRSPRDQDVHVFFERELSDPNEWRVRYRGRDCAAADEQVIAIAAGRARLRH